MTLTYSEAKARLEISGEKNPVVIGSKAEVVATGRFFV